MKRKSRYRLKKIRISDITITPREVIIAVAIFCIFLTIGLLIGNKISNRQEDENTKYNKALEVTDSETFQYMMDTNIPNFFVYGDLIAVDPVSDERIDGQYMQIMKVTEKYTRHTRRVSHTSNGKTTHSTESYYTWDTVSTDFKAANNLIYCDIPLDMNTFQDLDYEYKETVKDSILSNKRYVYYVTDCNLKGTTYFTVEGHNINNAPSKFYMNKDIEETRNELESSAGIIIFYVIWVLISIGLSILFVIAENNWLED